MTEPTKERCSQRITYGPLSHRPCTHWGVVSRDGKLYCRQHDPEAVKARRDARDAALDAEWKRERQASKAKARQDSIDQYRLAAWERLWKALDKVRSILRDREDSDSIWAVAIINETLSETEEQQEEDMEEE